MQDLSNEEFSKEIERTKKLLESLNYEINQKISLKQQGRNISQVRL